MKAVLVGVKLDNIQINDFEDEMSELKNLSEACDIEVVDSIKQNLDSFNPVTYIGSGKIEEIKMSVEANEADVIICNDELTPLLAMQLGQAGAYVLTKENEHRPTIMVGCDTRISGDMLANALMAGICSVGANAVYVGVIPTPAVA